MTQIMGDTPAARSGIKAGDILLRVRPEKATQPEDVLDASFFITAGDVVPITVMRGNQKLTFNVPATMHPASRTGLLLAAPGTPAMNQQAVPLLAWFRGAAQSVDWLLQKFLHPAHTNNGRQLNIKHFRNWARR